MILCAARAQRKIGVRSARKRKTYERSFDKRHVTRMRHDNRTRAPDMKIFHGAPDDAAACAPRSAARWRRARNIMAKLMSRAAARGNFGAARCAADAARYRAV